MTVPAAIWYSIKLELLSLTNQPPMLIGWEVVL